MKKYLSGLFVMLSVLFLLVSTAFASTDYTITNIKLTDLSGNSIEYAGGSCMVNVTVTKNNDVADGYVVISSYTEDETLIGFNYLFTSLNTGENATLGALVSPPADTKIGKVKAMVWDSLDGMTPLAASKTLVPGEEVEEEKICNLAIVEKYVDVSSAVSSTEYSYLDVVTLTGETKRLEIDPAADFSVSMTMQNAGIGHNVNKNAIIPLNNRIIEFKIKASTKRVIQVCMFDDTMSFDGARYDAENNQIIEQSLADDAVVLDATEYDTNYPLSEDYKAATLASLSEYVDYSGVLVGSNGNNEYEYVIITDAGAKYHAGSDFAVVAQRASTYDKAIFDDKDVYQLTVMQNGDNDATKLNVSLNAEVFADGVCDRYDYSGITYLKEGTVFYYTTDSDGLVDRIDVVLQGGYTGDKIHSLITEEYDSVNPTIWDVIAIPDYAMISPMTWFVDVDKDDVFGMNETIQLFIAPVLKATTDHITFGAVEVGNIYNEFYVNTNNKYVFSLAPDAKIYGYDIYDAGMGRNAFSGGEFENFDFANADENGRAWLSKHTESGYYFTGIIQFAFVMAVDGEITNALLFNV